MDIQGTLSSWGSSFSSAASSCGNALKNFGDSAVQKGKLGYNTTVSLISDNPKAALVSVVATAALAVAIAQYNASGDAQPGPVPPKV